MKLKKNKFYQNKTPTSLKDVDIKKVLVSNKISFGEKNYRYFIGYLYDNHNVKSLHITLPKTSAYVKSYNGQTKWKYFLIEDDGLLDKYNIIRYKVSADIKKELDSESVYNKELLKTKIKSHGEEVQIFMIKKFLR